VWKFKSWEIGKLEEARERLLLTLGAETCLDVLLPGGHVMEGSSGGLAAIETVLQQP
jgi:hypothetical protein